MITMGRWCLMCAPPEASEDAGTAEIDMIHRRTEVLKELYRGPVLYDLRSDPQQKRNLYRKEPAVARRLHGEFIRQLEELGTDESLIAPRRELA